MTASKFLPELEAFNWAGRAVFIIYDSDISHKTRVQDAEQRLCKALTDHGADTCKVRLPDDGDDKVGLDDYLLDHTDDDFELLVNEAEFEESPYDLPKSIAHLLNADYPDTEWVWEGFVLKGHVNLLYGDGGVGKSLLALHLAISVAAGRVLLDNEVIRMPVLALFAEDGEAEVSRRSQQIYKDYKLNPDDDLPVGLWCQPHGDTLLAVIADTGEVTEQPRLHNLRAELEKIGKPALVILDSMADLFAMNESLRLPVNAAMKRVLGPLCREFDCTILVLAHPSKASMSDGSHYSGSTAFNNAVRQRLTLEVIKGQENLDMGAPKALKLTVAKSNYGSDSCKEIWLTGCLMSPPIPETIQSIRLQRNFVLLEVVKNLNAGRRVVQNNGNHGCNAIAPKGLLENLKQEKGIVISPKKLKEHLGKLEMKGLLSYVTSDKSKSVARKATYEIGPNYKTIGKEKRKSKRTASSTASSSEAPHA